MKKIIILLSILFLFSIPVFSEGADNIPNIAPTEIVAISVYDTNTDPTIDNVVVKTEEVESLISQWKAVVSMIKSGGFGLSLLFMTIIPLFLVTIMTVGVLLIMILRFLTLLAPEKIDKKIDIIEDWVTEYLIKIPITVMSNLKKLRKQ